MCVSHCYVMQGIVPTAWKSVATTAIMFSTYDVSLDQLLLLSDDDHDHVVCLFALLGDQRHVVQ